MQTKEEIYNNWLTEDWLLDEINRTPNQQERIEKLYDYLMLIREFDDNLEEEM